MTTPTGVTNQTPDSHQDSLHKTLYTKSIDQSGWLAIKLKNGIVTVPEFVKVATTKIQDNRIYFVVLEGRYKGEIASLKLENKEKCLVSSPRGTGAKLIATIQGRKRLHSEKRKDEHNQLIAKLVFDGKKAMITLDSDIDYIDTHNGNVRKHSTPLPKGTYKIRVPEAAGKQEFTSFYGVDYHTVWFLIEYEATNYSNFVHVGHLSEGCVTVYQLEMWESVYKYLISNRLDKEGKYVGTITIE